MSNVSNWGPQDTRYASVVSKTGRAVTREKGLARSTIVHVSFDAGAISTLPAKSYAIDRNWYTPAVAPVKVSDVVVTFTRQSVQPDPRLYWTLKVAMSATPTSGAQLTAKEADVCHVGGGSTRLPGEVVSTIVHVSLPAGRGSPLLAPSSALVANSQVPSDGATKGIDPEPAAGTVAPGVQPPLPAG